VVCTSRPINDVPNQLNARHSLDNIVAKLSSTNTREPDVGQEVHVQFIGQCIWQCRMERPCNDPEQFPQRTVEQS
jgi:hypothetical protein